MNTCWKNWSAYRRIITGDKTLCRLSQAGATVKGIERRSIPFLLHDAEYIVYSKTELESKKFLQGSLYNLNGGEEHGRYYRGNRRTDEGI